MEKMTSKEFSTGMDKFLQILERQPNFLSPRQASADRGQELAEMAIAFIDQIHKLRMERVGKNNDQ